MIILKVQINLVHVTRFNNYRYIRKEDQIFDFLHLRLFFKSRFKFFFIIWQGLFAKKQIFHVTAPLKGLSSEMEGGIKVVSIESSL